MKCLACDGPSIKPHGFSGPEWCADCRNSWLQEYRYIPQASSRGGWVAWVVAGRPGLHATEPTRTEPGRCDCGAAHVRHAGHSTWCSKY